MVLAKRRSSTARSEVLGEIDTDPAWTAASPALSRTLSLHHRGRWPGAALARPASICNPPYGRDDDWIEKLVDEHRRPKQSPRPSLLVHALVSTHGGFTGPPRACSAICFTLGRDQVREA